MWLGPLQKSLNSEVPKPQICSLRSSLDRKFTGNKDVAGTLQQSLDSEVPKPQICSLRSSLDSKLTGNKDVAGTPTEKPKF